jgi:lipopolysaccharide transport system ATP-binding protein
MTVIKVEKLGKKYILTHQRKEPYVALRDVITEKAKTAVRKLSRPLLPKTSNLTLDTAHEEFWALKDVSFEVKRGDRIGIIGRNGAGKSTLLKILSRITEPTTGRIGINGRVASLLEVGTGFHPELTGRENIFLNGAVLGMTKAEIKKKFDEIVDFAEIEKFLDTPVKRYSSGMYVRLAFAVAAHLEPEILIVDEVLAVGDAAFQKKCLGKMDEVAKGGRTVLFVSHQMDMIRALCGRCILLDGGSVMAEGRPETVINDYVQSSARRKNTVTFEEEDDPALKLQVVRGRVVNEKGEPQERFDVFDKIILEFEYRVYMAMTSVVVNFDVKRDGTTLFLSFDTDVGSNEQGIRTPGLYRCRVELPCPLLKPGRYSITTNTGIANVCTYQRLEDVLMFDVELYSKPSSLLSYAEKRPGVIAVPIEWEIESVKEYQ